MAYRGKSRPPSQKARGTTLIKVHGMDVTGAVTEITNAVASVTAVGGAILGVLGTIAAFRVIRRVFG